MSNGNEAGDRFTFEELIAREESAFEPDASRDARRTIAGLAADEPWVAFTPRDRFGLAFSGGGIRSASFNLGVMQALAARQVLEEVSYLSTVSGGGYIGGFWTALRLRAMQAKTPNEPSSAERRKLLALDLLGRGSGPADESEPKEIRHVRQFGQFLIPRVGFTRSETWTGILAVVMGMTPTLLMTFAAIGVVGVLFVALNGLLVDASHKPHGLMLALISMAVMWLVHLLAERLWLEAQRQGDDLGEYMESLVLLQLAPLFLCLLSFGFEVVPDGPLFGRGVALLLPEKAFAVNWALGWFAVVSASVAAVALVFRILTSRRELAWHATLERVASRSIATALVWLVLVAAWEASRWALSSRFTVQLGGTGLVSGGLFLWFRDWLSSKPEESRLGTFIDIALSWLKPALPRAMAMIAATALVLGAIAGLQSMLVTVPLSGVPQLRETAATTIRFALPVFLLTLAILASAVDSSELGLHGFYRSRIARAFLGARNAQPPFPLTHTQPDDDFTLADAKALGAPIHLVCCAANHVQGDSLQTLGRGARSVVLSPHGVSLGGFAREPGTLTIGSALAASAAAFNSQMGSISLQFGRAVSFLMTAFNLRLGLWVHHPRGHAKGLVERLFEPGVRLFSEAAGLTRAELARHGTDPVEPPPALHLSDGGHFDNVGLYELVRRHCRYIIVSDATADAEVAFDDFGNAIRRVREDFGVEIEIDVAPLRPIDGLSRQHVAVGVIHYDRARNDTGTLVYLKPTFVGGEPPDVLQYRSRNAAFPHQGMADQFYDDVQWESYRRLGEHIASVAMPGDPSWKTKPNRADALFLLLRQRWHAFPEDHTETFLSFTNRCSVMESQIRATAPDWFAAELFPELRVVLPAKSSAPLSVKELTSVIGWVMQLAQMMEDVWVGSRLDDFSSHPLNEGWMAYFHRWSCAPSFRMWWPILRPIYSDGFRNFMKREFDLNLNDPEASGRERERNRPGATLGLITDPKDWTDDAAAAMGLHAFKDGTVLYGLWLENQKDARFDFAPVPVASLRHHVEGLTAKWKCSDLKVPSWLVGGGIVARFLDRLISYFEERDDVRFIEVDAGQEKEEVIAFYKSRGFNWVGQSMQLLRREVPRTR